MVSIIEIILYTKPTAEHQYLLRSSCHPLHTKRAFPFSLALRIRLMCSSNEMFKLRWNELTQAQYVNRRGYNLILLNQEIHSVHTITHKRLTHTYPSGCRTPPRLSLNIIYFSQTHLHSLILPTNCATSFKYILLVTFLRTNKPDIR